MCTTVLGHCTTLSVPLSHCTTVLKGNCRSTPRSWQTEWPPNTTHLRIKCHGKRDAGDHHRAPRLVRKVQTFADLPPAPAQSISSQVFINNHPLSCQHCQYIAFPHQRRSVASARYALLPPKANAEFARRMKPLFAGSRAITLEPLDHIDARTLLSQMSLD
jgi:hypothetical protein